jgi:hypothetical protein
VTTMMEEAMAQAETAASGGVLDRLLQSVSNAGTKVVFGEPVERDGRTVITVARARYGFGGGSGSDPASAGSGEGAGAGVMADPIGYIEMGPAGAAFHRIGDDRPSAAFMLAAGVAAWLVVGSLARFIRSFRG